MPTFTACLVDDPIAQHQGSTSAETNLVENVPGYCERECDRIATCPGQGDCSCDEGGDYCECDELVEPESCAAQCEQFIVEKFTQHGEECAEIGAKYLDCIAATSCEALRDDEDVCGLSDAELAPCEEGGPDQAYPDAPPAPPAGGAGPVTCSAGSGGGSGVEPFQCESELADCSDGNTYGIVCTEAPSGPPLCTCLVNGGGTKSFRLAEPVCPSHADVNAGCGFWLVDSASVGSDPDPTELVTCTGPSGGGGSSTTCSAKYTECDGRNYSLECAVTEGGQACTCMVDGVAGTSFRYPGQLCTLEAPGPEQRQIMNAACGWYLF